jgi:hypothetical protein
MTTQGMICAGAPSHDSVTWHGIDWAKCLREVRRLQVRIVKATPKNGETGFRNGALKGLSRMKGNFHVRFSGGMGQQWPVPTRHLF